MINENNIKLKVYNESEEWSNNLHEYNHSIFHCSEWINAACLGGNLTPVFIDFITNKEIIGKTSGIITNSRYTGRQLYFYSGPALKEEDYDLYLSLTKVLLTYSKDNKFSRLIIGSYGAFYSPEITDTYFHSFRRKEYVVSLDFNPVKKYSRNFRRKIKKAELLSPEVLNSKTDTDTIKTFLQSTLNYRRNHNREVYNPLALPYLDYDVIESLLNSSFAKTYSIETNNKYGGFLMTLEAHPLSSALLTGIDDKLYEHGISAFLYDFVYDLLYNKEFKQVNLGGTPEGEEGKSLAQFKKSMGAEELTVYGATTNFLIYPYKLLNPILNIGRKLPKENTVVKFLKRFV
jgi:hypothetical protein